MRVAFRAAALAAACLLAMPLQARQTPEQVRQSLVNLFKQKLPETNVGDWALESQVVAEGTNGYVAAIPLTQDNATNSADILAIGKKRWERKFRNGKTLANCFPNGGRRAAAAYPQVDAKTRTVVTLETAINRCLALHDEPVIDPKDPAMGPLHAYLRSLAEGERISVRAVGPAAVERFNQGMAVFSRRMGSNDMACASCHVLKAGTAMPAEPLADESSLPKAVAAPAIGRAAAWPRLLPGGKVLSFQMQFQRCMNRVGAEAFDLGSEEFDSVEYFLAFLSNGARIRALPPKS